MIGLYTKLQPYGLNALLVKTLSVLNYHLSVKPMEKTQEITETHGQNIVLGKYKKNTHIKCAHEGIFWLVMKRYEDKDIMGNLKTLTITFEEWLSWRQHPNYVENEQIVNQSVKEWETFLKTEEGKKWMKEEEE